MPKHRFLRSADEVRTEKAKVFINTLPSEFDSVKPQMKAVMHDIISNHWQGETPASAAAISALENKLSQTFTDIIASTCDKALKGTLTDKLKSCSIASGLAKQVGSQYRQVYQQGVISGLASAEKDWSKGSAASQKGAKWKALGQRAWQGTKGLITLTAKLLGIDGAKDIWEAAAKHRKTSRAERKIRNQLEKLDSSSDAHKSMYARLRSEKTFHNKRKKESTLRGAAGLLKLGRAVLVLTVGVAAMLANPLLLLPMVAMLGAQVYLGKKALAQKSTAEIFHPDPVTKHYSQTRALKKVKFVASSRAWAKRKLKKWGILKEKSMMHITGLSKKDALLARKILRKNREKGANLHNQLENNPANFLLAEGSTSTNKGKGLPLTVDNYIKHLLDRTKESDRPAMQAALRRIRNSFQQPQVRQGLADMMAGELNKKARRGKPLTCFDHGRVKAEQSKQALERAIKTLEDKIDTTTEPKAKAKLESRLEAAKAECDAIKDAIAVKDGPSLESMTVAARDAVATDKLAADDPLHTVLASQGQGDTSKLQDSEGAVQMEVDPMFNNLDGETHTSPSRPRAASFDSKGKTSFGATHPRRPNSGSIDRQRSKQRGLGLGKPNQAPATPLANRVPQPKPERSTQAAEPEHAIRNGLGNSGGR